jgi:uncharacterized protein (TIGR02246 family)
MGYDVTKEVAIRSLYQQAMDEWNRGSGKAFAAPVAEDGGFVGFDGMHLKGHQETITFHQQLFNTHLKVTRLVGKVRSECMNLLNLEARTVESGKVLTENSLRG